MYPPCFFLLPFLLPPPLLFSLLAFKTPCASSRDCQGRPLLGFALEACSWLKPSGWGWEWARERSILLLLRCAVLQKRAAAVVLPPPPPYIDDLSAGRTGGSPFAVTQRAGSLKVKWRPPIPISAIKQGVRENLRPSGMGPVSPALDSEVGR
ncbi:uncharacterized protein LY79DRAFT_89550 [Colletotrichum navitas]|uniref:Secreted protein n=1 Tax=Colletotrichum navitas TaxID=681940 RepID=A0AAD8Q5Q7_9PEZI|nr:uncharacterized protein LY79DRAFT_89550 [Colletotrichum navitas]KAK1595736.1 hypothetical protein LY79DRAFT_89550 [Colletotrichum navitas]